MRLGAAMVLVFLGAGVARADEYDRQIEMTATLLEATPSGFKKACLRLDGVLTEGKGISKCERGQSLLAIAHANNVVTWAMIAYPATAEDIERLWQKARELFGEPDVAGQRELTWRLAKGVTASAGFDHEYSTFALARAPRR